MVCMNADILRGTTGSSRDGMLRIKKRAYSETPGQLQREADKEITTEWTGGGRGVGIVAHRFSAHQERG